MKGALQIKFIINLIKHLMCEDLLLTLFYMMVS